MSDELCEWSIPFSRRPDGRDPVRYTRAQRRQDHLNAWRFLRRNPRFQRACGAVAAGVADPAAVAYEFGLVEFRDFRRGYKSGGSIPRFRCGHGMVVITDSAAPPTGGESALFIQVLPSEFNVGKPGFRIKLRAIRSALKSALAPLAPHAQRQLQIKRTDLHHLLQLLDLMDANATEEEMLRLVKPLDDRARGGQDPRRQLQRMINRAVFMRDEGYKQLAVLGHARARRTESRLCRHSAQGTPSTSAAFPDSQTELSGQETAKPNF